MSHKLHKALDNGHNMRIVFFMDTSKAFDKVWHKGIILWNAVTSLGENKVIYHPLPHT